MVVVSISPWLEATSGYQVSGVVRYASPKAAPKLPTVSDLLVLGDAEAELGQHAAPRHPDSRDIGEHLEPLGGYVLLRARRERDVIDVAVRPRERVDHEAEDDAVADPLALRRVDLGERHPGVVGAPVAAIGLLGELGPGGQLGLGERLGIGRLGDEGAVAAEDGEARLRRGRTFVHLVVEVERVGIEDADIERSRRAGRHAQVDRLVVVVVALADRGAGAVVDEQRLLLRRRLLAVGRFAE